MIFLSSLFSAFYYLLSCYSRSHTACQKGLNTMLLFDPHFHSVIRSFIHLFVDSLLHSAYSFHSGTQTHTQHLFEEIDCSSSHCHRRRGCRCCYYAIILYFCFVRHKSDTTSKNTVRESLLHTQTHINTRER